MSSSTSEPGVGVADVPTGRSGRFTGKVAFITGGAYGIGRAYGIALADEGAAIVVADVDRERTAATIGEFEAAGHRAYGVHCDVADEVAVDRAVTDAIDRFGGIDILVNNAGAHLGEFVQPTITTMPRATWRRALDVNVTGVVNCAAAVRPSMEQRGGGVIVNQLSIAGFVPSAGAYTVTKYAARGLVAALAHELAPLGIRVYGIAPGLVDSESAMAAIPQEQVEAIVSNQLIKRLGRMTDCASALTFFCSEDAAFITGEILIIGGGFPILM